MAQAALMLLLLALATPASAEFFEGRVVGVVDGDTIDVLVGSETRRVRLFGIDTPERGQPWADKARQAALQQLAVIHGGKSLGYQHAGLWTEALTEAQEALRYAQEAVAFNADVTLWKDTLAVESNNLAGVLLRSPLTGIAGHWRASHMTAAG